MNFLKNKSLLNEKEVKKFLIIFYIIGIIGFSFDFLFNIFKIITPIALIVNFFILIYFHNRKINFKEIAIFSFIFIFGLITEIIGVRTGKIFGEYFYGESLGPKIIETPLIIGINWLFLSYTTTSVFENFRINKVLKIIFASLLMIIYDIVLEQIAPIMDMWYWKNNSAPLQNYISWFIISLFFNSLIQLFGVKTKNNLSTIILICQFLFFVFLLLIFKLF